MVTWNPGIPQSLANHPKASLNPGWGISCNFWADSGWITERHRYLLFKFVIKYIYIYTNHTWTLFPCHSNFQPHEDWISIFSSTGFLDWVQSYSVITVRSERSFPDGYPSVELEECRATVSTSRTGVAARAVNTLHLSSTTPRERWGNWC